MSQSHYVDGFVLAVPRSKLDDYERMATLAGKVWKEHGALEYHECVADDVKPGKLTSFPQSVKLKEGRGGVVLLDRVNRARHRDRDQG